MKKRIIIIIISLVIIAGGVTGGIFLYNQNNKSDDTKKETTTNKTVNNTVTYKGKDGITALALLEDAATIETSGTGENAYVTSINGTAANPTNQFWAFEVNGTAAAVGAGSYVTKSTDTIVWKLSSF